jgi:hypothetical protein
MAILIDNDRREIWAEFQRHSSNIWENIGLSKAQLRAAVDATDDWIDINQTSFNDALPAAAKAVLTAKQKVRLFLAVAQKRFNVEV